MLLQMVWNYLVLVTKKERSPLEGQAALPTPYLQKAQRNFKHKPLTSSYHQVDPSELWLWEQALQKKKIKHKE